MTIESCPHSDDCPMYRMLSLAASLKFWQTKFCNADYEGCARYKASQEGRTVPDNLMPNGKLLKLSGGRS